MTIKIRHLTPIHAGEVAKIHRAAFDDRLPWLQGLHTPAEDVRFYREVVFPNCEVWGGFEGAYLIGFVAFRVGWIDQFYVAPNWQRRGVGRCLLSHVKVGQIDLRLWTFQRNALARRFYEKNDFAEIDRTDGARNEEGEPDVLYSWRRPENDT